jgi:polyferredoxin
VSSANLLNLPVLGDFLRWRYSRFALQLPLLLLAMLAIYDGFVGRQLAPANTATVSVWVHYRGIVALVLVLFGNLFCAACPLMLTRGASKLLKRFLPEFRFPFRNKYLVLFLTGVFLFSYEHFDLWASPWLTAWLMLGYFAAALFVDVFFPVGTFCKYVCPLGNFNFALSHLSPTQISAVSPEVCANCEGKYCLNGRLETSTSRAPISGNRANHVLLQLEPIDPRMQLEPTQTRSLEPIQTRSLEPTQTRSLEPSAISNLPSAQSFPGCETALFVPQIQSNQDCTLCFNCVRACPYDNVALTVRSPIGEALSAKPKTDWTWFVVFLTWAGLLNAFAMIPPYYSLATWLSGVLGTRNEALLLGLIFAVLLGLGCALTLWAARGRLRHWVGVLMPLAVAIWGGHYLFHFVTGANTLLPNIIVALSRLGLPLEPPGLPATVRLDLIFPFQVAVTYLALLASGFVAFKKTSQASLKTTLLEMLPMVLLALTINTLTILIFSQPMQARGSLLLPV